MLLSVITLMLLAFVQTTSFSLVSRARNRDNMTYHAVASTLSNGLWYLTMQHLVVASMAAYLLIPYLIGTVLGSLFGSKLSMKIEKLIGAST